MKGYRGGAVWFLILLALASQTGFGLDIISIDPPFISEDSGENRATVKLLFDEAASQASGLYSDYFTVSVENTGARPDYTLAVIAVFSAEQSTVSLTLKNTRDGSEITSSIFGPITPARVDHVTDLIFYLWSGFHGFFQDTMQEPPLLVEELPADIIGKSAVSYTHLRAHET